MTRLERDCEQALRLSATTHALSLSATTRRRRPWASALFVGARLSIAVEGDDDARLDQWLTALPDIDLPLSGYFVADAEVIERNAHTATLELLVIEA